MTNVSIISTSLEIGVIADYTLNFGFSHTLINDSILIVKLPSIYSSITVSSCLPSPCAINGRTITYSNANLLGQNATINLMQVQNPLILGITSSFIITSKLYSN